MSPYDLLEGFKPLDIEDGLLSQQVAQYILGLIHANKLKAGDRLPSENEMSERLGVSRTVTREAIKLLNAIGFVDVKVGVGSYITEPSLNILETQITSASDKPRLLKDLNQVRHTIEPAIAALAAQHATPEQLADMEFAVQMMHKHLGDPLKYIEADNFFHCTLAEASGNSVLILLNNSIVDLLKEARFLAVQAPQATERANKHHRTILDAIIAHDSESAFSAMESHISQIVEDIQEEL